MIATVIGRAALRTRMRDAKISGMVDQIGIAVFGNMAAAGTLALLIWDKTDPRLLVIWLVAISLLTTWRIYIHRRIKAQFRVGRSPTGWARTLVFLLVGSGLVWGSLSLFVLEPARSFQIAAVVSVTIGVIAGALGSLATYRPAFWGFSLAAILPLVVKFLSFGTADYMLAAALLVVFLGILMRLGLLQERILEAQIRANFEKDDLVEELGQAHQAAQNGQAQVAAMLETSPAGIAIFVPRGDLLFVNARYVHLFGYRDAEQARSAGPPPSPSDPPQAGVGETDAAQSHRCRQRTRDGRQWWCLYHQRPIIYHGRQAIIAWYVDITSQVAVEEKAVASAQFLSLTLETMDQGIMVVDADERVILFNQHACQLTGVPARFLAARPSVERVFSYQSDAGEFGDLDAAAMARMRSWTVAADGAGGEGIEWRRANGDWVLATTHRNRQGWRVRTLQDISQIKRIEAATAETARLLQLTLDSMGQGLTMYDGDWNLVVRNDRYRQHFDLPTDDYWEMATFDDLVGATMRQDYGDDWRQRLSVVRDPARMAAPWRRTFRRPNGRGIDLLSLPVAGGGFVVTSTDISDRLDQEAKAVAARRTAEAAARSQSNFLATMSHEIRTPMNGVVTVSDILRQTALDGEQTQLVRVLGQSARGLMAIIDDILDISKIEAGMLSIRPQPVAPAELIEQVLDLFQTSVEEKGLRQVFHVDTLLPDQILADPDRLRQLIANLLGNAVKFTERGEIVVTAGYGPGQSGRDELRVDVIDTGVGIDAAHQAKLFEPFWQSDVSTTRSHGGTGLGLTICKRICDLMGGRIEVESKRRPGAHLWFAVPAPMVAPSSMGGVLSGSHILIIGYAPSEARALVAMIAAAGGRAEHLANAKAATLKARAARAAATTAATTAIIFDGSLGTAALSAVRAHFEEIGDVRQAGLPVVISTSMIHQQRWQEDPPKQAARPPVVMPLPIHFRPLIGTLTAGVQDDTWPPTTAADTLTFAPPSLSQARAQGAVVLVVEDNEINRLVIQRLLDRLGFAAEMAKNGSAALTLLRRQRFGLVLADIHMSVMDGLKLAKEIRRIDLRTPAGHPIPIVALTADVLVSTEAVTRQAGMDAYLRKPIGIEDLRDVLAEFMPQALPLRMSNPDADEATVLRNGPHIGAEDGGESRAEEGAGEGAEDGAEDDLLADIAPETLEPAQFAATFEFMEADAQGFFDRYMAALGDGLARLARPQVRADLVQVRGIAHDLKSTSALIGAAAMTAVMTELQDACDRDDAVSVAETLPRLPALHAALCQAHRLIAARLR